MDGALRNQALQLRKTLQQESDSPAARFRLVMDQGATDRPEWLVLVQQDGVFLAQVSAPIGQESTAGIGGGKFRTGS